MKISELLEENQGLYQIKKLPNGKFELFGPSIDTSTPNWSASDKESQGVFPTLQRAQAAAKDMQEFLEKEMSAKPSFT